MWCVNTVRRAANFGRTDLEHVVHRMRLLDWPVGFPEGDALPVLRLFADNRPVTLNDALHSSLGRLQRDDDGVSQGVLAAVGLGWLTCFEPEGKDLRLQLTPPGKERLIQLLNVEVLRLTHEDERRCFGCEACEVGEEPGVHRDDHDEDGDQS